MTYIPRPGLTVVVGVAVGVLASVPAMESARIVADELSQRPQAVTSWAYVGAAASGALLGAALSLVLMHAMRWGPRIVFASVMMPALAFCAHVGLMTHHEPTAPIIPLMVGTLVFGVCVASVPPVGRRRFV